MPETTFLGVRWRVKDRSEMNVFAQKGVVAREFALKSGHGEADYLLYADGKGIRIIEAKPEGLPLKGVET